MLGCPLLFLLLDRPLLFLFRLMLGRPLLFLFLHHRHQSQTRRPTSSPPLWDRNQDQPPK
jgi:hypothetical protein